MGDGFACTVLLMVHELVLSNGSSAVLMTDFAESEVRRNNLVSCFSNLILLPFDHSPGVIYSWKSCPCGICVPSNATVSLSKKTGMECLSPSLEGLTGSRIHPNANGASSRWREAVTEWMHSLRLQALCTLTIASLSHMSNGIMILVGRTETLTMVASFSWITCSSPSMCKVRPVWCGVATI